MVAGMLHLGVDEAGYGPLLGPLVVGLAAFRLDEGVRPEGVPAACGWHGHLRTRLEGLVTRAGGRRRHEALPVPVDDSKAVKQRTGLAGLARGVGLFASALDQSPPAHLEDLLVRYSDRSPESYAAVPWFADLAAVPLPTYPWTGPQVDTFAERGVQALDLRVLPIDAGELNASFDALDNKASALGLYAATLLLSVLDRYPGEDAVVVVDRHGGRRDYTAYLTQVFPFAVISRATSPEGEMRYRVRLPDRRLHFRFVTKGDAVSLAVGWASMAAKLTRELFMASFNRWFEERLPGVRPTAGYTTDGRRFLSDIEPLLAAEPIDTRGLVRSR
ncbi:MAG: hypothetical protein O2894_06685 [Planctomycetota bacterium]|nr:hypothetical protein [Planctomycetota bacterium]